MYKQTIFLGCDHRGFKLKEVLKQELIRKKIDLVDFTPEFIENVDYPDPAKKVSVQISKNKGKGILICGTGMGMSIAANRFPKVRATLVGSVRDAKLSRMHNDSNILVLGGNTIKPQLGKKILMAWLNTSFLGGKHRRRLDKIRHIQ